MSKVYIIRYVDTVANGFVANNLKKRLLKKDLEQSEKEFGVLAEETGGGLWLPVSAEEMIHQAVEGAQMVDSQYVITYKPQRSINTEAGEYLKIDVISRRVGLKIRARRGYLAKPHW